MKYFEMVPNEVLRMILEQLSFSKRRNVERVSLMWRFLSRTIFDVGGALVVAAGKGERAQVIELMKQIEGIKIDRSEKEKWTWIAQRVAAKKGNFDCHSGAIFSLSEEEQSVDAEEIEEMLSENDLEKLKLLFQKREDMFLWSTLYAFKALKVFIVNGQVDCMDLLMTKLNRTFCLPDACVLFMVQQNQQACFQRFHEKHRKAGVLSNISHSKNER